MSLKIGRLQLTVRVPNVKRLELILIVYEILYNPKVFTQPDKIPLRMVRKTGTSYTDDLIENHDC